MSKLLLTLILTQSLGLIAPAQTRSSRAVRAVRLSKEQPSVYISFVREAKISSVNTGGIQQTVWLRLHNNTRWEIWLGANDVPKEYGDAALHYAVEETKRGENLFGDTRCHACSNMNVPPGKSILFSVPREHLTPGRRIRIGFRYGWEDADDAFAGREVEHSVFFYGSKLVGIAK